MKFANSPVSPSSQCFKEHWQKNNAWSYFFTLLLNTERWKNSVIFFLNNGSALIVHFSFNSYFSFYSGATLVTPDRKFETISLKFTKTLAEARKKITGTSEVIRFHLREYLIYLKDRSYRTWRGYKPFTSLPKPYDTWMRQSRIPVALACSTHDSTKYPFIRPPQPFAPQRALFFFGIANTLSLSSHITKSLFETQIVPVQVFSSFKVFSVKIKM